MENISATRIRKEHEMLEKMQSKLLKISFTDSNNIEVLLTQFNITYYIALPKRYPFLSPKITAEVPADLTSFYLFSENILDDLYEESWTPMLNLHDIIEKLVLFTQKNFTKASMHGIAYIGIIGAVLLGLVLRSAMFSQSYSGFNTPPLYGDFEAQRHWMELTANLPSSLWYKDTVETDPAYWKLDYPPLTAWHSYLCGVISEIIEPESMEYGKSRGYQSSTHLFFMRTSVMVGEILIFIPAILLFFRNFYRKINPMIKNTALTLVFISPPLILIDYGHFQYNNIMLGLALCAIVFATSRSHIFAAISISLSINFKIMALYYSLPFAAFWVILTWQSSESESYKFHPNLRSLIKYSTFLSSLSLIAAFGIITFTVLWYPWLNLQDFFDILSRIFPFHRGVFEDKVATFWCVTSTLIKFKEFFSGQTMSIITGIVTLLASAPFLYLLVKKPNNQGFLHCLSGVSLSFFLFSYHVHEKTILLPLLPISLLTVIRHPDVFQMFVMMATFSLYPLLKIDRLVTSYFALQGIFYAISQLHIKNLQGWIRNKSNLGWYLGAICVHLLEFIPLPEKYPYLFNLVVAAYSFAAFCYVWGFLIRQFYSLGSDSEIGQRFDKEKTR